MSPGGDRERAPARFRSLRGRFLLLISVIYVAVGGLAAAGFFQVAGGIIRSLAASYARQYASQQKGRLLARLEREVVLARKLVDSPLLLRFCLDEADPVKRGLALEELESYRRLFADRSYFFVVDASGHYYFNNAADEFRGKELRYTVTRGDPTTAWYFATLEHVSDFALHVDNSAQLGVTKVWVNAVVKDGEKKVGLGGSGLDLTPFLKDVVHSPEAGVETILVDAQGFVQGHSDAALMEANARIRDESKRLTLAGLIDDEAGRGLLKERLARLTSGASDVETFEMSSGGRHVLVAATYMKGIDWAAVVFVDPARVIRFRQFLPILLVMTGTLLVAILLVSWSLDRLVLARLGRLTRSTREIAAGRYDVSLPVDREDELGDLTRSFNEMTATVRDHTQNLEAKVADRTVELLASNRKVMDSIRYARLIQSALLAKPADLATLLPDSVVFWRPRDVVGGDFYALYPDGAGGFLLAVADCTGHGVPGAFMTMAAKALLDRAVATHGTDDPASLLAALNATLRELLQQEGAGGRNGLDLGLARVKPDRRVVRFAGARIALWVQSGDGAVTVVKGDRESLGYAGSHPGFVFRNQDLAAVPGQRYFLLTDGLLDQAGGAKGFGLGPRRLQEAMASWIGVPVPALAARIDALLGEHQGRYPQRDDITLVGFRLSPGPGVEEAS